MTPTPVAATPPIVTVAPERKLVPLIVIAVPPEGDPDGTLMEKGSLWESSEVLPAGSVAVIAMREPDGTPGSVVTSKWAFPDPSVVTSVDPR